MGEIEEHATDGRTALQSGIKELESEGFLKRKRNYIDGKISGWEWILTLPKTLQTGNLPTREPFSKESGEYNKKDSTKTDNSNNENSLLVQSKAFDEKELVADIIEQVDLSYKPTTNEEKQSFIVLKVWHDVNKIIPNNQTLQKAKLKKWHNAIRRMIEIDDRTYKQIFAIWDKVQNDSFWRKNILSTSKLRDQFDQLLIKLDGQSMTDKINENAEKIVA